MWGGGRAGFAKAFGGDGQVHYRDGGGGCRGTCTCQNSRNCNLDINAHSLLEVSYIFLKVRQVNLQFKRNT